MKSIGFSWSHRWFADAIASCNKGDFHLSLEIDVTEVVAGLKKLKSTDSTLHVTLTHVFLYAIGKAIAQNPDLNVLRKGYRLFYPKSVSVGLSVAGESFLAPLLVVTQMETMTLKDIARVVSEQVPLVRKNDSQTIRLLNIWGWLAPFGWMRRLILRTLLSQIWFRLQKVGVYQVTTMSTLDSIEPIMFNGSAVIALGRVRESAHPEAGSKRSVFTVTFSGDHVLFDGMRASRLLTSFKNFLQDPNLLDQLKPEREDP